MSSTAPRSIAARRVASASEADDPAKTRRWHANRLANLYREIAELSFALTGDFEAARRHLEQYAIWKKVADPGYNADAERRFWPRFGVERP